MVAKRICGRCKIEKELTDFKVRKRDGREFYEGICKKCTNERNKENANKPENRDKRLAKYKEEKDGINKKRTLDRKAKQALLPPKPKKPTQTKEQRLAKVKEWQIKNPDKRKKSVSKYHETHKKQERQYKKDNNEEINKKARERRILKKDEINAKTNERRKDPIVRLKHNVSGLIRYYIKDNGGVKNKSTLDILPYSFDQLKAHLESLFEPWMNWQNWGVYNVKSWNDNDPSTWKWQIDHIIPQSEFDFIDVNDDSLQKCWALSNLRPLNAKLNVQLGTRLPKKKKLKLQKIPNKCPNCNGFIIWNGDIFNCENHSSKPNCNGFAGNKKTYVRIGIDDDRTVVINFDHKTIDIWIDNEEYQMINFIPNWKYTDINDKFIDKYLLISNLIKKAL